MKRWTFRILVCLLLGAATTIAVAFACALWSVRGDFYSQRLSGTHEVAFAPAMFDSAGPFSKSGEVRGFGLAFDAWERTDARMMANTFSRYLRVRQYERARHTGEYLLEIPPEAFAGHSDSAYFLNTVSGGRRDPNINELCERLWQHVNGISATTLEMSSYEDARFTLGRVRTGWPLLCMEGGYRNDWKLIQFSTQGKNTAMFSATWLEHEQLGPKPKLFPFGVMAWPFAVNTIAHGALWFVIWFGSIGLRRRARRRAGWCLHCGYALRGEYAEGCPECGWGRGTMDG